MKNSERRQAQNEASFRAQNERHGTDSSHWFRFVCECNSSTCAETVRATHEEYEIIRGNPTTFLIAPGHEKNAKESVMLRTGHFSVVVKHGKASSRPAV